MPILFLILEKGIGRGERGREGRRDTIEENGREGVLGKGKDDELTAFEEIFSDEGEGLERRDA